MRAAKLRVKVVVSDSLSSNGSVTGAAGRAYCGFGALLTIR